MDKATTIRLIVLVLAWVNAFAAKKGYNLPVIGEDTVALGVAFASSLWATWKDNDITKKARERKEQLPK